MKIHIFAVAILLSFFSLAPVPISAKFFPNISSIPWQLLPNGTKGAWEAFKNFSGKHPGEKIEGLGKLKQYFHRFGYISDLPSNFTDDFDDVLESALKTYQKNFNLNVTGQLDDQTIEHITLPRCGNADIVNGTTTMNSGKTSSYNTSHFHTVAHYSFFPGTPLWPSNKRDLTYAFLPDNQLTEDVKDIFSAAFARWSAVIPMTFTETDSYNSADITIGFYAGDHGDGEPFDGVLGTLAHAFSPPSGRFHLDLDEDWVIAGDLSSYPGTTAVDLESVAVHEIGHVLGLGHSSNTEAIMYPSITSGTRKVELGSDDIEGIQLLYGSNPNYNGSSSPSTQQQDTSDGSGAHYVYSQWRFNVALAVGFLVLIS